MVLVSCPNLIAAKDIAGKVLSERLIACANIIPGAVSIYEWKGQRMEDEEVLILFKTKASLVDDLRKRVLELHSYETPEFIELPTGIVADNYLSWVNEICQVKKPK